MSKQRHVFGVLLTSTLVLTACGGSQSNDDESRNVARVVDRTGYPVSDLLLDTQNLNYSPTLDRYITVQRSSPTRGLLTGYATALNTAAPADTTTAERLPVTNGQINSITSDGSGGLYVAGQFTTIGDSARMYLAHVLPDGSVDQAFDAELAAASMPSWVGYAPPEVTAVDVVNGGQTLALTIRAIGSAGSTALPPNRIARGESVVTFIDARTGAHVPSLVSGVASEEVLTFTTARPVGFGTKEVDARSVLVSDSSIFVPGGALFRRYEMAFGDTVALTSATAWNQAVATSLGNPPAAVRYVEAAVADDSLIVVGNLTADGRQVASFSMTDGTLAPWDERAGDARTAILDAVITENEAFVLFDLFPGANSSPVQGIVFPLPGRTTAAPTWSDQFPLSASERPSASIHRFGSGFAVVVRGNVLTTYGADGKAAPLSPRISGYVAEIDSTNDGQTAFLLSPTNSMVLNPATLSRVLVVNASGESTELPLTAPRNTIWRPIMSADQFVYVVQTPDSDSWRCFLSGDGSCDMTESMINSQRIIRLDARTGATDTTWFHVPVAYADPLTAFVTSSAFVYDSGNSESVTVSTSDSTRTLAFPQSGLSLDSLVCDYSIGDAWSIVGNVAWSRDMYCGAADGTSYSGGVGGIDTTTGQPVAFFGTRYSVAEAGDAIIVGRCASPVQGFECPDAVTIVDGRTGAVIAENPATDESAAIDVQMAFAAGDAIFVGSSDNRWFSYRRATGQYEGTTTARPGITQSASAPSSALVEFGRRAGRRSVSVGSTVEAVGFVGIDTAGAPIVVQQPSATVPPQTQNTTPAAQVPVQVVRPVPVAEAPATADSSTRGGQAVLAGQVGITRVVSGNKSATVTFASPVTGVEHVVSAVGTTRTCRTSAESCTVTGLSAHLAYSFIVYPADGSASPSEISRAVKPFVTVKRGAMIKATSIVKPASTGTITWKVKGGCRFNKAKSTVTAPKKRAKCTLTVTSRANGKKAISRTASVVVS